MCIFLDWEKLGRTSIFKDCVPFGRIQKMEAAKARGLVYGVPFKLVEGSHGDSLGLA